MAKAHVVKFPFALKHRHCHACGRQFERGEVIYRTNARAYCKSCYEKMLY